jgi:ribosomal protein L11 methyltransferase
MYHEVAIACEHAETQEILIALLSIEGYDSFMQEQAILKAYIVDASYDENTLLRLCGQYGVSYKAAPMEQKNWNEEWEKNYEPVIVNNKVAVRAAFHQVIDECACNIIITPQMSFGTGHHSTTKLMLQLLSNINCLGTQALDYGCGTGVLGIYSALQGASNVLLCDIDQGCVDNTLENITLNNAKNCNSILGNIADCPTGPYDIIVANINLNILTDNMQAIAERLIGRGTLLLSGFYDDDAAIIEHYGSKYGLYCVEKLNDNNWCALHMTK